MPHERRKRWTVLMIAAGVLFPAWRVLAHGIQARAYARAGEIVVEAFYHDGTSLEDASVTIQAPNGDTLASGTTNAAGDFSFPIQSIPDRILVVVDEGNGHRTERTISREELGAWRPTNESRSDSTSSPGDDASQFADIRASLARLEASADHIQQRLAQLTQPQPGVRSGNILAGIGIIFGITGVAAYGLARKAGHKQP